jgi:Pyruvate/2-oxoacid:ferredoxin oxidoreductase delta subunit
MSTGHHHRVCTYAQAEAAIRSHERVYVNECFCRGPAKAGKTKWPYCGHAVETCMGFERPEGDPPPYAYREIPREEALRLFEDWKRQGNFFRFMMNEEWVCCCCSCGCGWFRDEKGNRKKDPCEKSPFLEKTDLAKCTVCGACVKICPYEARSVDGGKMKVKAARCYGCSACEYACPEGAIAMVPRKAKAAGKGKTKGNPKVKAIEGKK